MALSIAITGGTGFVGGHTLDAALAAGHSVRALARSPQPEREDIVWISGSLYDQRALEMLCDGADAVIHIAGLTNAASRQDFEAGNILGTAYVRRAARTLPLVHVSSQAARAPWLSTYGWSKLMGEQVAAGSAGPVTVVRPPAVYGPGDREFLELLKLARYGYVPMPAGTQTAMIYGADLGAALVALAKDLTGRAQSAGKTFEIEDGRRRYSGQDVAGAMGAALGRKVRAVPLGRSLLALGSRADTLASRLSGKLPRLSRDRASYMSHRDWSADGSDLLSLGIWRPRVQLMEGMAATVASYRAAGLLS